MNFSILFFYCFTFWSTYGNIDCKAISKNDEKNLMRKKRAGPADYEINNIRSRYRMDLKARYMLARFLKKIDTSEQLPQFDVLEKSKTALKKKGKKNRRKTKGKGKLRKSKNGEKRRKRNRRKRKRKGRKEKHNLKKKHRKSKSKNKRKNRKHRRRPRNARGVLSRIDFLRKHDGRKEILQQIKEMLKIKDKDITWEDLRAGYLM